MNLFSNKQKFIDDIRKSKVLNFDEELIASAWDFAIKVYGQQPEKSGGANFSQPVDVARLLLSVDCDSASIAAALLYSTVESKKISLDDLKTEFSPEIVMLVEGVTKLAPLDCPPDKAWMSEKVRYEQLRKFFVANISDYRVALIKLADRLYKLTTLGSCEKEKDRKYRIAGDALHVFAPIAEALELGAFRSRIQDLAFRYLEPETYTYLEQKLEEKWKECKEIRDTVVFSIEDDLQSVGINAMVQSRKKEVYSIYQKMKSYKLCFDEVYDIIGIRIIVSSEDDCFQVKSIVDELGSEVKYDNWISTPRGLGGYQSLHKVIRVPDRPGGTLIEIQIRSVAMHRLAERGSAAHWIYKLGGSSQDPNLIKRINMLRETIASRLDEQDIFKEDISVDTTDSSEDDEDIVERHDVLPQEAEKKAVDEQEPKIHVYALDGQEIILAKGSTPVDFAYHPRTALADECCGALVNHHNVPLNYKLRNGDVVEIIRCIRVFSPNGDVISLPKGSTPIDFAYHIHTVLGHECRGAWVNGRYVALDYQLQSGDIVKIDRRKGAAPYSSWITDGKVKSPTAQQKIRQYFNAQSRAKQIVNGRVNIQIDV